MAEDGTVALFVKKMDPDVMRMLKVYAAQRDLTMREAVEQAILRLVQRGEK